MTINCLAFQYVPDCNEQMSSDCHDRLGTSQSEFEPDELFFPKRVMAHGDIGSLHHGIAQVAPPGLGDMTGGVHLSAVMNAGPQPGIANQVFGIFEALDRSDGSQDGERIEHGNSWKLCQQGNPFIPGCLLAQNLFDRLDLLFGKLEGIQIRSKDAFFDGSERQGFPPGSLLGLEGLGRPFPLKAVGSISSYLRARRQDPGQYPAGPTAHGQKPCRSRLWGDCAS